MLPHWNGCQATQQANTTSFQECKPSLAIFTSTTRNTGIRLPEVLAWLFNVLKPHFDGFTYRLNYSQCCSPANHKATKLTTLTNRNLEALQVPQLSREWIPLVSLHDVHFVRLINAESLFSLRARDMAIIFTRHTT